MKKLIRSLLLLCIVGGLASCHNDLESMDPGNNRSHITKNKPILKTVKMGFGGDIISEIEEPLLRAEDGDTYAAINVFRTEKDVAGAKEEKYAYGLFKKKDGIEIDVLTGYNYRFEATILVEREDKVFMNNKSYTEPFLYWTDKDGATGASGYSSELVGKFKYTTTKNGEPLDDNKREYFRQLTSGTTNVDAGADLPARYAAVSYPRVKRFYGRLASFDPGIAQTVEIPMDYKCFGLKIEVVSLPSGYVTVKDVTRKGNNLEKTPKECLIFPKDLQLSKEGTSEWEGLYSMNNLIGESESFTLQFTWHKAVGVTETFTTDVTISAKTRKILRLNINGSPNYETKGNIVFIMDSETLSDDVQYTSHDF